VFGSDDGIGPAARFTNPDGIVADGAGSLYVVDTGNHTIRQVDTSTWEVTTFAGMPMARGSNDGVGPAAGFFLPSGIACDRAGRLYVTDTRNQTVRQIEIATAAVTTLAGTPGTNGYTDGHGAAIQFEVPLGIAADAAGNVYVADSQNHVVRKVIVATGTASTLAGAAPKFARDDGVGALARFRGPQGIVSDALGNLYVGDRRNDSVRKIDIATGAVVTVTQGSLWGPSGVVPDNLGNLYVAGQVDNVIGKIDLSTGDVTPFVGAPLSGGKTDGVGNAARFQSPGGLTYDGAGSLYVADTGNHLIRKIDIATRTVTTLPGGSNPHFYLPLGVAADGPDTVYVADTYNRIIRKIEVSTGTITTVAGVPSAGGPYGHADGVGSEARFLFPQSISLDGKGNAYIGDAYSVRKLVLATGEVTTVVGDATGGGLVLGSLPGRLNRPFGVAPLPMGDIAIVDWAENAVLIARPSTIVQ
jgi:sugar lactone lactonase YvrE